MVHTVFSMDLVSNIVRKGWIPLSVSSAFIVDVISLIGEDEDSIVLCGHHTFPTGYDEEFGSHFHLSAGVSQDYPLKGS